MSSVTCWMRTPSQPRRVSPNWRSWSIDGDRGLRGNRKADADRAARRRDDRRVDADDLAIEVEQRAAGIAAIDGGVGLDVVVVRTGIDVAVARRDDAGGHRAAEAERIADRDHPFAEPQLVGIAELHGLERLLRLHPQQREIDLGVAAEDLRLEARAVVEDDGDLVGVGDDVIVGDHDAGRIDDEAGAQRRDAVRRCCRFWLSPLPHCCGEFLKNSSKNPRRASRAEAAASHCRGFDGLRGGDVDDRIDHFLGDIGDAVRSARRAPERRGAGSRPPQRRPRRCGRRERRTGRGSRPWAMKSPGKSSPDSAPDAERDARCCAQVDARIWAEWRPRA